MANTCKYYKQQKYVSYNSGVTWSPLQEFRKGELYESQSADCDGGITLYRWFEMSSASTYWCDSVDKWTKDVYQQSIDNGQTWTDVTPAQYRKGQTLIERNSEDCGYIAPQYRWYPSGYTCDGYDKWEQSIYQVSYDSGSTWQNVVPTQYSATTFIEHNSEYCGYVPPTPPTPSGNTKFFATYDGGQTYSLDCDSGTTLEQADTKPSGYDFQSMTSAIIGDCITSIGICPFMGCISLPTIVIPDSVTSIGPEAFRECSGLTSVTIGSGVTTIGRLAFRDCTSLTTLIVNSNGAINGNYDYWYDIPSLANVTIGDNVTSIGDNALVACHNLTSCTIGSNVISIGDYAFRDCDSLPSIDIPNSVTSIGYMAFYMCTSLTRLNSSVNGVFNIPNGVTSIGVYAFCQCSGLTSIDIPNSVTSIGNLAFDTCRNLASVTIGSGVTSIGNSAFQMCYSLTSVTIHATTPPTLGSLVFEYLKGSIYVPSGSVNAYKSASGWRDYANKIKAIP